MYLMQVFIYFQNNGFKMAEIILYNLDIQVVRSTHTSIDETYAHRIAQV